jgi:hypothetical protein
LRNRTQQRIIDFGVMGGAFNATMAQNGTHDVERDALAQHRSRGRVTQYMRTHRGRFDTRSLDGPPD